MTMVSPELLRRFPFFAGLSEDQLRGIAMLSQEEVYDAGAVIVRENDEARKLYVLSAGSVELLLSLAGTGRTGQVFVGSVAPGEPFGVSALVEPYQYGTSVRAEGAVKAIAVDGPGLRAMCAVDCELCHTVMLQLARALRDRLHDCHVQLAACAPEPGA